MEAGHTIVGGVVSTTITVWLQVAMLVAGSMAAQVRVAVKVPPQPGLVTVATMTTTLLPAEAVGGSKVQGVPHWTTLLLAQEIVIGGGMGATGAGGSSAQAVKVLATKAVVRRMGPAPHLLRTNRFVGFIITLGVSAARFIMLFCVLTILTV
jgi:hypothetical protein